MPLSIIVGGFFGDEGKGKISAYLALKDKPAIAVRCGAINAGHTVIYEGRVWRLRIVPSFFVNASTKLMVASGALLRLDVFFREVEETGVSRRILVDRNAGIIEDRHVEAERADPHLAKTIGSTLQGVGYAMADRILRRLKLAKDVEALKPYLVDVALEVNEALDRGEHVYVEGVQGTFLSLYHGTYPYVTSRDTTASAFASEVGVGPKRVDDVVLVFKAFVTRVGEGPLENELPHEEAVKLGLVEVATVTGRSRRAAPFNVGLAKRAVMLNSATQIAITKIDALFPQDKCVTSWDALSRDAKEWIDNLEAQLKVPITLISTGEELRCTIDRRRSYGMV